MSRMVADANALGRTQKLPISLLGIPFDPLTVEGAAERVAAAIAEGRPRQFVTANVDFLVKARRDAELRRILLDADHVLCDGTPLVWASRWLGNPLPGRTAGSDLVPELARLSAERGWRLFLLGGAPGVAEAAARRLEAGYPGLPEVATYAPPFRPLGQMDDAEIVRRIEEARPDILLVSFGCPKQEKWIAAHYRRLGVPVNIGVGATVDFLAGRVPRAPSWMRRTGIEWTFRLACEPRRLFRRYMDDLVHFLPALWEQHRCLPPAAVLLERTGDEELFVDEGCGTRFEGKAEVRQPKMERTDYGVWVQAGSDLHRAEFESRWAFWSEALGGAGHCLLDLAAVRRIDSTGLALLGWWQRKLAAVRRNLILFRPSAAVRQALERMRLAELFVLSDESGPVWGGESGPAGSLHS